ncbi:MAG: hypothetical protein GX751_07705 [Desulfuromonadaceae bacterium]|nr:hypothetical protein [Desulfuromonadaceae bacterium]
MYFLTKEIEKLDVPLDRIEFLFSAMNEVQVALPGFPGQRSSAYLCAYGVSGGYEAVAVLVLFEVRQLAFYRHKGVSSAGQLEEVIQMGIQFVEAMGFMLNDLDFKNLSLQERERIWDSFPLGKGSGAIPRASDAKAAAKDSPSPPAEEAAPPRMPLPVGKGQEGVPDYEKRFELSRKMGRLLASF